mmetsp:Transcript_1148/g.3002  ORF Transcript_1148/g.3002 Transcript_1148/m.3002 type:complete len:296 (-) Transcript_1148:596-1483(-)
MYSLSKHPTKHPQQSPHTPPVILSVGNLQVCRTLERYVHTTTARTPLKPQGLDLRNLLMKRSVWFERFSSATLLFCSTHLVMISSNSDSDTSSVASSSPIKSGRTSNDSVASQISLTAAEVSSSSDCSEALRHSMNSLREMERAPEGFSSFIRFEKNFLRPLRWWKKTAWTLTSCVISLILSSSSPVAYGRICVWMSLLNWSQVALRPKFLRWAIRMSASKNSGSLKSASYMPSDQSSSCWGRRRPGRTQPRWISKKEQFSFERRQVRTKVASCFMLTASSDPSASRPWLWRGRA